MLEIVRINNDNDFKTLSRDEYVEFLFNHLDRFGDPKEDINKCLDYAFSTNEAKGGFALAAFYDKHLVGALIMNKTGMQGYIPENILVYVAVNSNFRGKGIGRQIIERSFKEADGNIKLHVEYDNPAKRLYERIGFTTKYAEMRYNNK